MDRKEEILHKFGAHLAALRRQKKFSVQELATAAGLKSSQLMEIEAGKVNLRMSSIMGLAEALGVTPADLLESIDFGG